MTIRHILSPEAKRDIEQIRDCHREKARARVARHVPARSPARCAFCSNNRHYNAGDWGFGRVSPEFHEKKYKGAERQLAHAINQAAFGKGNQNVTVKIGDRIFTVSKSGSNLSISTKAVGLDIKVSGTFSSLKGREGFSLDNVKVSGDVHMTGDPGRVTVFSGQSAKTGVQGPAYETQHSIALKPTVFPQSLAPAQHVEGGHPSMIPVGGD